MFDDDPLLDTKQVAPMLDIKPGTLEVWRSTGRVSLPYVKVGHLVKYRRSDVLKFIERNTRSTTTKEPT